MLIRFWGTRGSIPTPGAGTVRYGGNTSCVEVRSDSGTVLVLDCGTGARPLGERLLREAAGAPLEVHVLLSHTHWDHIQGFPFFSPVFVPGARLTVYGPGDSQRSLSEALAGQMQYTYFPVNLAQLGAGIVYRGLGEEEFVIGDLRIRTQYLNHPAVTLGYRIEAGGLAVVYSTDHEPFSPQLFRSDAGGAQLNAILHEGDRRHAAFLQGADLLIHDAQYTEDEYQQKRNWGHSTIPYVVNLALAAGVKRAVLFHHDPSHDDAFLDRAQAAAEAIVAAAGGGMEIIVAAEGQEMRLMENAEHNEAARLEGRSVTAPQPARRPRLLLVDDDRAMTMLTQEILKHDGYEIDVVHDGAAGLDATRRRQFDLVLLDLGLPKMGGLTVLEELRRNPATEATVVVVLTGNSAEEDTAASFAAGASDYLTKPFTPAQLRTRVRGWLTRAGLV